MKTTKTITGGPTTSFKSERVSWMFDLVWQSLPNVHKTKLHQALRLVADSEHQATALNVYDESAAARKCIGGDVIFINADNLLKKDDAFLAGAIAHELAHVVLKHTAVKSATNEHYALCERHADELAVAWGHKSILQHLQDEASKRPTVTNPYKLKGE